MTPYLSTTQVSEICRELVRRGWWVTDAERTQTGLLIGFDFMPRVRPNWLKAFEPIGLQCTPDGIERLVNAWREDVLIRLKSGDQLSATVRRLLAEHGRDAVHAAMFGAPFFVKAA